MGRADLIRIANRKPPSIAELQGAVDEWNRRYQVGQKVTVKRDNPDLPNTGVTTSEAYVMNGHSAVIHVSGISGCYALDRVTAQVD